MKRCIAILLALFVLTACAAGGPAPASEPESSPSPVSEPIPEASSSEPEPDPMPDLQPGRVLAFGDERMNPAVSGKAEQGTQAELDRWKEVVRDPAIVRLDFNKMHQEEMELPVDQAQRILTALRDAEVRLYEGNPDPSTGGGCTVIAYDEEENVLFRANYLGDWFEVWFPAGDSYDRYYFDGERTTLDALLRSEYGKAADITPPEPDHAGDPDWPPNGEEINPDTAGPQENPDTSLMGDDVFKAQGRAAALCAELQQPFDTQLSRDSYSYYCTYHIGDQVILEVGVIDEAAVDAFLASWTGEKWDKLDKKQGKVSRTKQVEFMERAKQLDWTPVEFYIESDPGTTIDGYGEQNLIYCWTNVPENAPAGEAANWQKMPQPLKDLMKELGIPEDMVVYHGPRYTAPGANPDT